MTTAQEIRARVERADRERIQRRADAATVVGDLAARRDRVRAELVAVERQLAEAVTAALGVMTLDELGLFIDERPRVINGWMTGVGGRGAGSASRRALAARRSRSSSAVAPPAGDIGSAAQPADADIPAGVQPGVGPGGPFSVESADP